MPALHDRSGAQSAEVVLAEFESREKGFIDLCTTTRALVDKILTQRKIFFQSVQARVKDKDKLQSKYCDPDKDYKCLDDISDIVGLRIIVYFEDAINKVKNIIEQEFDLFGPPDDKRIGKANEFGYSAVHMDCGYSKKRLDNIEHRGFIDAQFEIQITTVLGHAWAEMHHAWYDSGESPSEEERRFHRLAAVLELADHEFVEIRKMKAARERVASVQVDADFPDIPITPESLKAFIEQKDIVAELDGKLAATHNWTIAHSPGSKLLADMSTYLNGVGFHSIHALESKMISSKDAIVEFARRLPYPPEFSASMQRTPHYCKGQSALHCAYILAGAFGVDRYSALLRQANFYVPGNVDLWVRIAGEVASKYHLSTSPGV